MEIPTNDKKPFSTKKHRMRAKLIFNPSAGATRTSPIEIVDVIHEMQAWKLVPEAYLVEPGCDLPGVVQDALAQGFRMFVVCGGDGTISAVARSLADTRATLGIIPIGTQNNIALSLNIPNDIPAAIAILRNGRRIKVDIGMAAYGNIKTPFLEACTVGLISTLYPSADDIQHGNLAQIGDFLATLAASPPAEIHLLLDNKQEIHDRGHVVLVSNMPYIGFHYQVGSIASFQDGLLDVLFFADQNKLELLGYVLQGGKVRRKTHVSSTFMCAEWTLTPTRPCRSWQMGVRWEKAWCVSKYGGMPWQGWSASRRLMCRLPWLNPRGADRVNSHNGRILPEETVPGNRSHLILTISKYRPVAWLVFLTASLVLFLAWMPSQMRVIIWHALVARGILSSMLLVFSLLAVSLVWSAGQSVDVWAFLVFNLRGSRPVWLDWTMLGFTQIGSGMAALAIGLILLLASDHLVAYEFILGSLTLWMVVELVKALVRRSRPIFRVTQARILGYRAMGRSFPSGHTSQAFFTATLIAPYFHASAWVVFLLYTIALLVGITRMYVGAHYPRDVLAGAILGIVWGLLGVLVNGYVLNGIG